MATKHDMGNRLPGFFINMVAFLLAYGTMHVASGKSIPINQTSTANQLYEDKLNLFNGDPTYPWYQQVLPPEPYPGFYIYVKNCLNDLGDRKCIRQIFDEIFHKNQADVNCSCKMKQIGHMCVMSVAGTTGHMDKFKSHAQRIYNGAQQIIDRCDKLPNCPLTQLAPAPAPNGH